MHLNPGYVTHLLVILGKALNLSDLQFPLIE